ncbi:MAG: HAD family phosphatase [Firmicutes bacterium]|nr:HAD family phosphatase [Bacillota bacterium]
MIKAVIFDMDGLMIDSEFATYEEYLKILNDWGYEYNVEMYKHLLGKRKPNILNVFKEQYNNQLDLDLLWDLCHERLDARLRANPPLKPGLMELLKYLKENGYKMIIATSSVRDRVEAILGPIGVLDYFDDSVCGDEVVNGKPHPETFLKACEKLGIKEEEGIVLEDSESGVMAAYNGNIPVICVPDLKYPEDDVASKATVIVKSLHDVIDYLEQNK